MYADFSEINNMQYFKSYAIKIEFSLLDLYPNDEIKLKFQNYRYMKSLFLNVLLVFLDQKLNPKLYSLLNKQMEYFYHSLFGHIKLFYIFQGYDIVDIMRMIHLLDLRVKLQLVFHLDSQIPRSKLYVFQILLKILS